VAKARQVSQRPGNPQRSKPPRSRTSFACHLFVPGDRRFVYVLKSVDSDQHFMSV